MMPTPLVATLLLAAPTHADPVVEALRAELDRAAAELALDGAQPPYFLAYDLMETEHVEIRAVLGGVIEDERAPRRELGVAVRVGGPDEDNANFTALGQGDGFGSRDLVIQDHPLAVRHDAWLLTDREYKQAVENLARKQADRRAEVQQPDRPPDYAPGDPSQSSQPALPPPDGDTLAETARALSAAFRAHPQVESSTVYALSGTGRRVLMDSLGTQVQRPLGETDLRVVASVRAPDGQAAWDHASWYRLTADQLPALPELQAEAEALTARLERWRQAPSAEEEYVGPVIFEGDAAVALFRSLLLPHLSGTPPSQKAKGRFGQETARSDAFRLGRRVLPKGYTVVDDPLADPTSPASFAFDDEGVPAQRVELIQDGVSRSLLASRTPSKDAPTSNGHGRCFPGQMARGMPSLLAVTPDRETSWRRLVQKGLTLAADYDLDYLLVVRRLRDPSIEGGSDGPRFFLAQADEEAPVPAPLEVVRLYADGREEPVRGLRFEGLDRRSLRDIVAAGTVHTRSFLAQPGGKPWGDGATHGLPVTLTAPTVLLSEVELLPDEATSEKPPRLPSPLEER